MIYIHSGTTEVTATVCLSNHQTMWGVEGVQAFIDACMGRRELKKRFEISRVGRGDMIVYSWWEQAV